MCSRKPRVQLKSGLNRTKRIPTSMEMARSLQREMERSVQRCVADRAIFDQLNEFSVAAEFDRPVLINGETHPGIQWDESDKFPGSRAAGFALMRERLIATAPGKESGIREAKGLFVVAAHCPEFMRTIPVLPRDKKTTVPSPPPVLRRRRGVPVNKNSKKRAPEPMTARGDSLRCADDAHRMAKFHALQVRQGHGADLWGQFRYDPIATAG